MDVIVTTKLMMKGAMARALLRRDESVNSVL
ncbi:hypothetical protein PPL19_10657 [Pseudomonas psychrotolerans L19]|nr:hypothetical protein PPL19_10657 [Pseudomonas psychrotolerans L19]